MATDTVDASEVKPATAFPDLFRALAAPNDPQEIKSFGKGGRTLRYITARTAMNRLDNVLGNENWWDEYYPIENAIVCKLSIRLPDGQVITKQDAGGGAGMADAGDDEKSAFSDAFKRACVKFGVGRYLYNDGVPEFAADAAGQSAPAAREATVPTHGRMLFACLKDQEKWTGVPFLIKHINAWGKAQGFAPRMVDWTDEQVSLAWAETNRKLKSEGSSVKGPDDPPDTAQITPLPDAPTNGKALFGKVKDLEQEHGITLFDDMITWAKGKGHKNYTVDWPLEFVTQAWYFISERVQRHTGRSAPASSSPPHSSPNGNSESVADLGRLRKEFYGLCADIVKSVYGLPQSQPADVEAVKGTMNDVCISLRPGWTIASMAELNDAKDLGFLIAKAKEHYAEVSGIPF